MSDAGGGLAGSEEVLWTLELAVMERCRWVSDGSACGYGSCVPRS